MASDGSLTAIAILLFSTFTQGHFGNLDRSYSVNVTEGQPATLPCRMEDDHEYNLVQIEWKKVEDHQEHMIAIYNPRHGPPHHIWNNLATFPAGTVKIKAHLQVTAAQVSARVTHRPVREGDNVTIICTSALPAGSYFLWPSKNKSSILENKDGRFTLPNVTREDSDLYTCQPGNSSLGLSGHSATVNVTVNYLREIECDTPRSIEVTAGQNVTITCAANSSQSSQYTWRKDGVEVSRSSSLRLGPVSAEQAGVYVLTAAVTDTGLQRQAQFSVAVRSGFTELPSSIAPPISPTATNDNSPDVTVRSTAVSMATEGSATGSVSPPPAWSANSAAPKRNVSTGPAGPFNATLPPFDFNATDTENASSHGQPATTPEQPTVTPSLGSSVTATVHLSNSSRNLTTNVGVTNTESADGSRYVVLIVLPVVLLLLVILLLYRRHMVQRKMDMPPPFKPPPTPVKYTSVRTQEASVTVQQPQGNGTQ
ncbi:hypothetical protein COCON_G00072720 [Conger conger]|uniref:Ig-like domain-containing protein n=1 Tax=Conger conger TaxID=82655 RepID=A0A9Q1DN25_CONCO|nr:hypothetical protein COCON_G00072720 [Conger conger]